MERPEVVARCRSLSKTLFSWIFPECLREVQMLYSQSGKLSKAVLNPVFKNKQLEVHVFAVLVNRLTSTAWLCVHACLHGSPCMCFYVEEKKENRLWMFEGNHVAGWSNGFQGCISLLIYRGDSFNILHVCSSYMKLVMIFLRFFVDLLIIDWVKGRKIYLLWVMTRSESSVICL